MNGREAPSRHLTGQSRQKYERHPVAQHGRRFDLAARALRFGMQGGEELENLLAMFARAPTAPLHFRAGGLG